MTKEGGEKTLRIRIDFDGNFKTDWEHFRKVMDLLAMFKSGKPA